MGLGQDKRGGGGVSDRFTLEKKQETQIYCHIKFRNLIQRNIAKNIKEKNNNK